MASQKCVFLLIFEEFKTFLAINPQLLKVSSPHIFQFCVLHLNAFMLICVGAAVIVRGTFFIKIAEFKLWRISAFLSKLHRIPAIYCYLMSVRGKWLQCRAWILGMANCVGLLHFKGLFHFESIQAYGRHFLLM